MALGAERRRRELYEHANAVAVGASTGFTGSTKPLESFERALLGSTTRARTEMQHDLQHRLQAMARAAGVRMPSGADLRKRREQAREQGRRRL